MSQTYTPPSTILGISRLAKSIRQQRGIKHTQALEAAARVAGFQSFKHAKRALSASATADTLVPAFSNRLLARPGCNAILWSVHSTGPSATANGGAAAVAEGSWLFHAGGLSVGER
jgi:hypothetical protein